MCGVFGIAGKLADRTSDSELGAILNELAHRGPDQRGIWRNDGVVLGHTRLSIRDLSLTGTQPMVSASGRSVIAYNGEIYGFRSIASKLENRGHSFRGSSDTEVILEALEIHGPEFLSDLNGMFGLAFWDRDKKSLLIARDPMGIKPLYIAQVAGSLLFCSELSPLLSLPGIARELDTDALSLF